MPVILTLGTGIFPGLNAQEAQKLNFSLQYPLSSGLLGTKVGTVLRQGLEWVGAWSIDSNKGPGV